MGKHERTGLNEILAAELNLAGALLESLAVQLCLDPLVSERHAERLQLFDQITQMLGEIASALRSEGTFDETLETIRLESMRGRIALARG